MPYENIPGVGASYLDGAFRIPRSPTTPRVLVVGPAESGLNNSPYQVTNVSSAAVEFGAATPVLKITHELMAQGADNIAIVRSGGKQGSILFTDDNGGTLLITPEGRDDEILARYALFIENDSTENRYVIYDLIDQSFVYDSDNILALDTGVISVEDSSFDLFTSNDLTNPDLAVSLADVVPASDFTTDGDAGCDTVLRVNGADGLTPSLVERYAALNTSYHMLDYKDGSFIVPADVYIDDANIALDASAATYGYYWLGVPVMGSTKDKLGYVWQYVHSGRCYTYFTDTATYFSVSKVAAAKTVNTNLVLTCQKTGKGGNANTIQIDVDGAHSGSVDVTITENTNGGLDILVENDGTEFTDEAVVQINLALIAYTTSTGVTGDTLIVASGGTSGTALADVAKVNFTSGAGGHVLTHEELTGDSVPSAVSTKFSAGQDAELREVNFAHQLASFCNLASTVWSAILGAISFKEPESYSRTVVAEWIGQLPTITDNGQYKFIDSTSENGTGILGNKFLAGFSKTSAGYRSHLCVDGNSTDGYAYGGFIKTAGASLPNGVTFPYGIDSADEALDSGGKPIDIGKHIFVTYDWVIHSNGYNGGTSYRGAVASTFLGRLLTLPENQEPILLNGRVSRVSSIPRIHSSQLNDLASIRAIGLRREEGFGITFTSAPTAAHPDSDYTAVSTIRAVNRHLQGIRNISKPYIGRAFSNQNLITLQAALDNYLFYERQNGMNQGAKVAIQYNRTEKLMGQLKVKLRIVPPFSIRAITVETSLAAEESEL